MVGKKKATKKKKPRKAVKKKNFKKEMLLAKQLDSARDLLAKQLIKEKTLPKEQAEKIAKKLVRPSDVREPEKETPVQEQVRRRPIVSPEIEEQPRADYTSKTDTRLEEAGGLEQKVAGAPETKTETPEYKIVDDRVQDYVRGEEPEDRGEGLRAQITKYLKSVDVEKARMGSSGG